MIRAILFLSCDECGRALCKASVCTASEQTDWEAELTSLRTRGEIEGWRFMPNFGICPECIEAELTMADWLQEPEDYLQA
jgi:hypothetical protein